MGESLRPLHDTVILTNLERGERLSASGIIIPNDDGKDTGIRARWAQVYAVGPEQKDVKVGDWILMQHGRWTHGQDLTLTGQKPLITHAKKSIANFKLREGMAIGCKVTLRGERMYQFLDKLVSIALPRVRDFQGVSKKAFDGRGNYTLGVKEQLIFPEINYDKVNRVRGMDIVLVTTAKTDLEGLELLTQLGMPFKK